MERATQLVKIRKDTWASREAAHEWLARHPPFSQWDPRSLRVYTVRPEAAVPYAGTALVSRASIGV